MSIVIPRHETILDFEDKQAQVTISVGSTANSILSLTLRNNYRCYLSFVGEAWDAAIDTFVTKRVKVNGTTIYQLQDSKVQIAPPEQPQQELSPWIEVPQGSTLLYEADLASGASASGKVTARFRVYYVKIPEPNI